MSVGFWAERPNRATPDRPWPQADTWEVSPEAKMAFLARLEALEASIEPIRQFGMSLCRICHKSLGSGTYNAGGFSWPQGYSHYLRDHNVAVDRSFYEWVMK